MFIRGFRALTTDVEVKVTDSNLAPVVAAIIATYPPPAGEPTLRYRINQVEVWRGTELVRRCEHPLDAPSAFEFDLYQQVVAACTEGIVLHAAAVCIEGAAAVLTGPSGSGKTTLTLHLLASGADYITEECTLLRDDDTVLGLPRPITRLPDDTEPPPITFERRPLRRRLPDGRVVGRSLLLPPPDRIHTAPTPLACIIALERDPDCETAFERLTGSAALALLQQFSMNAGAHALRAAVAACASTSVHRLRSRTAEAGAAAIRYLCRTSSLPPRVSGSP